MCRFIPTSLSVSLIVLLACAHMAWAGPEAAPPPAAEKNTASAPASATASTGSASGSFLSSYIARTSGDQDSAARYLEQLLRDDPENPSIMGQLLVLKLMNGKMPDALQLAAKLKSVDNHEMIVDLLLILEQARIGQFRTASEELQTVSALANDTLWLPLINAWLNAGQGKLQQPVEAIDFIQDTSQIPPFLHYHLALINDFANFPEAAERQYTLATGDIARAPYRAVEALSNFYLRQGQAEKSASLLTDYAAARPEGAKLIEKPAAIGAKPAHMVPTVQDGLGEILFTMASVLYNTDQGYDTQIYLQMSAYLRPGFSPVWLMLGNALENNGSYADAAHAYSMVTPQSPLYTKALLRKAFILDKQGDPRQAMEMLDRLAAEQPGSNDAYIAKGDLLRTKSQFRDAAAAYTLAIEKDTTPSPTDWALYFARGACLERIGEMKKAEADFRQSLALNPDQPEVLNYLGYMWLAQDMHVAEAADMISRAYAQRPDEPHIIDSMAWIYYKSGHLQEATELLERALALMPNDPSINDHLGDVYWQTGRKTEARFQWNKAINYSSDDRMKNATNTKLQNGLPVYKFTKIPALENALAGNAAPAAQIETAP